MYQGRYSTVRHRRVNFNLITVIAIENIHLNHYLESPSLPDLESMTRTVIKRIIRAPVGRVFGVVSDIAQFSEAIPHIVNVEMLSGNTVGVGARFRETRLMRGREATTELVVTEYEADRRVRFVSDEGGTIWDTVFSVEPIGTERTQLTMIMDAKAYKLRARLINPLIRGMIARAIEDDMDAVKVYCEYPGDRVRI